MEFRSPEWIPCRIVMGTLGPAYADELYALVEKHPRIFPYEIDTGFNYRVVGERFKRGYLRDSWGCLWKNLREGVIGIVVEHPLADWDSFDSYEPPDPLTQDSYGPRDWEAAATKAKRQREKGLLVEGNAESLFDRLYALRGFENLMMDIATEDPRLPALVDMLLQYELKLVDKWLEIGVDRMYFHTDIGTQQSLMIHPEAFRKHIKPMFATLFRKCRNAGVHVRLSSDGVLLDIVDDLIECGVSMHDPQYRANGLDRIAAVYKGRLCLELDLDRQLFPFCTPAEVREHIQTAVGRLYLPEGGLMLAAANSPDVPIENVRAQCEAFEEFCFR